MINSTYNPFKNAELGKQNLNFNGVGVQGLNLTAGQSHSIDLLVADDQIFTGASVIVKDGFFGDKLNFQIVDKDGAFYPAGTVLLQSITNWGVMTDKQDQGMVSAGYPAKIKAGLYLRLIYVSTGAVNPSVIVNYYLHKVLA